MSFSTASQLVLWLLVVFVTLALAGLAARVRQIESAGGQRPTIGRLAPRLSTGEIPESVALRFVRSACRTCGALRGSAAEIASAFDRTDLELRCVVSHPDEEGLSGVALFADPQLADQIGVSVFPTLVTISDSGRISRVAPIGSVDALIRAAQELPTTRKDNAT